MSLSSEPFGHLDEEDDDDGMQDKGWVGFKSVVHEGDIPIIGGLLKKNFNYKQKDYAQRRVQFRLIGFYQRGKVFTSERPVRDNPCRATPSSVCQDFFGGNPGSLTSGEEN